jgi:hypothetical protein
MSPEDFCNAGTGEVGSKVEFPDPASPAYGLGSESINLSGYF